jgi:hypothetical protein
MEKQYYTYLWLREDGTPYYVGKGSGNRAFVSHPLRGKMYKAPPKELIIVQYFESEGDALFTEKFLIALYGRIDLKTGILRNLTDGGEDPPIGSHKDHNHSVESRKKMSESHKKLWDDPVYADHMSEVHKGQSSWVGRKHSEESKKKNREAHLGKKQSENSIKRRVLALTGQKRSEEIRNKLKKAQQKRREKEKLIPKTIKHGTRAGYYKCRCDLCLKWRRDYRSETRRLKRKNGIT